MKNVYTVPEVAKLTRFSEQTIREWIRDGYIKGVRPGLRAWRIPRTEVQRLLAQLNIDESVLENDGGSGVQSEDTRTPKLGDPAYLGV